MPSCPFCHIDSERKLIAESAVAFALFDKYPVSPGHALIIPHRHCSNYFDLSLEEQHACMDLLNEVKDHLVNQYNPDGFNIGININESAGQTIGHVHLHIIPRYHGDVKEPRGGVRGVILENQNY